MKKQIVKTYETYQVLNEFGRDNYLPITNAFGKYGSGVDGGAFVEFISLNKEFGSRNIPKYTSFPGDEIDKAHTTLRAFYKYWFKNKDKKNIIQLATANTQNGLTMAAFAYPNKGHRLSVIFCQDLNNPASRNRLVVHELAHHFNLTKTELKEKNTVLSDEEITKLHIDRPYQPEIDKYNAKPADYHLNPQNILSPNCWDNGERCVMCYYLEDEYPVNPSHKKFDIDCIYNIRKNKNPIE